MRIIKNQQKTLTSVLGLPSIVVLAMLMSLTGCSVVGIHGVEEARYKVIKDQDQFQVRDYKALVVAETIVDAGFEDAGKIAFKRLFGYISGANRATTEIAMTAPVMAIREHRFSGKKIAMTAPVTGEKSAGGWRYSFVLPEGYTLETAPVPSNSEVKLVMVPARKAAVVGYSGFLSEVSYEKHLELLRSWMREQQLEADSPPRLAGYDPPWTPGPWRRNEVLIRLK